MTIAAVGDSEFSIGRVASRTFGVIGRNLVPFLALSFLAVLPQLILGRILTQSMTADGKVNPAAFGSFFLTLIITWLAAIVLSFALQAALVQGTIMDLNGRRASFGDSLMTGFRMFLPLLGLAIVSSFAVGLAFLLLIVPGLMLMTAWAVPVPALVVEGKGVFASLGRSAELTRGHRWAIFGIIVVFFVGVVIVQIATRPFFGVAMMTNMVGVPIAYVVFDGIVRIVTAVVGATGTACVYYELRAAKEGIGPQQLASVFE